jgi:hypothetical protein
MFVYTREQALAKPPVVAFLRFWMENSAALVPDVGYVPLTAQKYEENLAMLGRSGGMRSDSAGTKDGTGDAASGS